MHPLSVREKMCSRSAAAFLCILLTVSALTACANPTAETWMAFLGFDTHDYLGEAIIATHEADSAIALELAEMTRLLTFAAPDIPSFEGAPDAAEKCRDAILNYMLNANYSKYTGNIALLDDAAAEYPRYHITTIIPAEDFAATVYRYFGGNEAIGHKDGSMFKYLSKLEAYTSVGQPLPNTMEIQILSCEETRHTYRFTFINHLDSLQSSTYQALIIKRTDNTLYFKSVDKVTDNQEKEK